MFEDRPRAKVNLTLEVIGRRDDGYHDMRSIFLRIGLADRLTVIPGGADGADTLTVTGLPGVSVRRNLVTQALDAVRAEAAIPLPTLDVTLDKVIPAAAGLGGGSSDCASAIRLAQAAWGIGLSPADELAIGARLGSDVPFFVSGAMMAVVEGRGERVSPLPDPDPAGLLLVTPGYELSTAAVFDRFDEMAERRSQFHSPQFETDLILSAIRFSQANDLWDAAASLAPGLAKLRWDLEEAAGRPWLMSGSGPTLFALYPSVTEAADAGQALVTARLQSLANAQINAVDLAGPDPAWRYP